MKKPDDLSPEAEAGFFRDMGSADPLGVIVKAGVYIDNQLLLLIDECVVSPKAVKRMDLSYNDRVNLAIALGLEDRFRPPLNALGTIRNRFAHRIDASLGDSDADALHNAFAPDDRSKMQDIYRRLQKKFPDRPEAMKNLSALDRFVLAAVTLRQILVLARMQVMERNGA